MVNNPVNRIHEARLAHFTRDYQDPGDYSNISHFSCQCGQDFRNHQFTKAPDNAPSKSAAHVAEMIFRAMGGRFSQVQTLGELAMAPLGAVIRDSDGTLMQLVTLFQEIVWETQQGETLRVQEVQLPAEVIWTPED